MRLACLLLFLSTTIALPQNGIAPAWDVKTNLKQLVDQTARFKSAVDGLRINEWVEKGASETYLQQQRVVQTEVGYLSTVSSRLADQPEKLSLALDAYFRLQSIEGLTGSLADGASRYQDEPSAQALQKLVIENSATRIMLRQYVMDLSVTKEDEFAIAEKEAQRCQAELNRNPLAPPPPTARPGKKK